MITLNEQSNVILVNEVYPTDCLIFKALVNADQPQYRVPGHEDALIVQRSPTPAVFPETSLQLKPEKGRFLPPQQAPSRTEGSEQTCWSRPPEDADLAKGYSIQRNTVNSRNGGGEHSSSNGVNDDADPVEGSTPRSGSTHPTALYPQNDLDKAISEAQATKDLVSIRNFDYAF